MRVDKAQLARILTTWTPGIVSRWNVGAVRSALDAHAIGNPSQVCDLAEVMLEDDEVSGAIGRRVDAVIGSAFSATPADDSDAASALAEQLGTDWYELVPEDELGRLLADLVLVGYAVGTLDWHQGSMGLEAHARRLPPRYARWCDSGGYWEYQTREGTERITPGDGKWIFLSDSNGVGRGAVRALAVAWLSKQFAIRDWSRYNERHGLPIIKAYTPATASTEDKEAFADQTAGINSDTVALLANGINADGSGFDLDLLEATDGSWESFKALIERSDRKIAITITGSHLASEQTGSGSRAAAETHRGVSQSLAQADAERLSTQLREQVVEPWTAIALGADPELAAWPTWKTTTDDDAAEYASGLKLLGEALTGLKSAGYKPADVQALAARFGLVLDEVPVPEPVAPPVAGRLSRLTLARARSLDPGYRDGSAYRDAMAGSASAAASEALGAIVSSAIDAAGEALSVEDGARRLLTWYADRSAPDSAPELDRILTDASLLAQLAGRYSGVAE